MKFLAIWMATLLLLCAGAYADTQDVALKTEFEDVCRLLTDAQWLDAQCETATIALDRSDLSVKHTAASGERYAELILTEDGQPFQYTFYGDWENPDDLRVCIEACLAGDTQGLAEALAEAYRASESYSGGRADRVPKGTARRGQALLDWRQGWLCILNLDELLPQRP